MISNEKRLVEPVDVVVFDCDGTLSILEGINELAKMNEVGDEIEHLTEQAMSHTGLNPALYEQRLARVKPTLQQINGLGLAYFEQMTPDVLTVIQQLQKLNKNLYIISAGVNPAVTIFAELLNIPASQVMAVDLTFDEQGNYVSYDKDSLLIHNDGKYQLINELKQKHPRIAYIGDGMNDYSVYHIVTRFIGYGGVFYREKMARLCEHYLTQPSMLALLPLILTSTELQLLS